MSKAGKKVIRGLEEALVLSDALKREPYWHTMWRCFWKKAAAFTDWCDGFITTGWRKGFGWVAIWTAIYSYIQAPALGHAINYDAVNVFLGLATAMYVSRGVEKYKHAQLANGHGLVNNEAIQ